MRRPAGRLAWGRKGLQNVGKLLWAQLLGQVSSRLPRRRDSIGSRQAIPSDLAPPDALTDKPQAGFKSEYSCSRSSEQIDA